MILSDLGLFPSSGARWRPGSTEWRRNLWPHGVPHVCEYANSLFSPFLLGLSPRTIKLIEVSSLRRYILSPPPFQKLSLGASPVSLTSLDRRPPLASIPTSHAALIKLHL